ncbi:MAG TPA: CHAT domain-containing protein [Thermoanaerobaculia bacterium]|nr:CHAT domain-containing protein [Thermoanaerobaculia bacterium]
MPPPPTMAWQQAFSLNAEEAQRALRTGEHAALLEDYFGPEQYAEMRRLAQEASTRRVRGGPRVLILPGILGSTIGVDRFGPFDDVYWFDPIDIAKGHLAALALPNKTKKRFQPLGVILFTYLKLRLSLELDGYDADFHPFDWRLTIPDAAENLLDRLFKEKAAQVHLVAHSMGGLVARTAIEMGRKKKHAGAKRIGRVIMLGTPNHGSFAPVQALRGTYGTVVKVARLDQKHNADELARNVFGTFPGLYEMLPSPAVFSKLDLYDAKVWPSDKPRPRQALLDAVEAVKDQFASGDERMFLIAGVNKSTTVDLRIENGSVEYALSDAGDGTVPLQFALLDGIATWYVEETHGSLPNNGRVARAVADILERGETKVLASEWSPDRAMQWVEEDRLRTGPFREAEPAPGPLSQTQIRELISEYAAPESAEIAPPPGPQEGMAAVEGYAHRLDRVLVGRQLQHRIDIRFAHGSITQVDARAYVLGIFEDVTPGGAARAIDERMDGAITELTTRRMFSGRVGEVFVMPSGRNSLRADMVAFVGLGPFDRFNHEVQQIAAEHLIRLFIRTNIEEFATVLFGAGSGGGAAASLQNLLTGFLRGLRDADRDRRFRRLILAELDPASYREMKEELVRLSTSDLCAGVDIVFDEVSLPPEPPLAPRAGVAVPSVLGQAVYLIVRQEGAPTARSAQTRPMIINASVLTAGGKASVVSESIAFDEQKWTVLKTSIEREFTARDLPRLGGHLAELMLPPGIRTVLARMKNRHLVVVHDAASSRVPWEIVAIDGWFPAAEAGLSHRYLAANLSIAKWLEERRAEATLRLLLVGNPTEDLEGAEVEYERIEGLAKSMSALAVDGLYGEEATKPALLSAFRSGKYDVVHYAGHAFFDERDPKNSGIICHGDTVLSGADLSGIGNLPTLMFFNACEAARVRKRTARVQESIGLAEAFLRGGVATYVGTYWPVGDAPATEFATSFYQSLFEGKTVGKSVNAGRAAVRALTSPRAQRDWADYVHYGNADFVLKLPVSS